MSADPTAAYRTLHILYQPTDGRDAPPGHLVVDSHGTFEACMDDRWLGGYVDDLAVLAERHLRDLAHDPRVHVIAAWDGPPPGARLDDAVVEDVVFVEFGDPELLAHLAALRPPSPAAG